MVRFYFTVKANVIYFMTLMRALWSWNHVCTDDNGWEYHENLVTQDRRAICSRYPCDDPMYVWWLEFSEPEGRTTVH